MDELFFDDLLQAFGYDALNTNCVLHDAIVYYQEHGEKKYAACFSIYLGQFILIGKIVSGPPPSTVQLLPKTKNTAINSGWKLHISIDNSQLAAAWNIIVSELVTQRVVYFKVINEDGKILLANNVDNQAGKQVTIYAFKENRSTESWQVVIQVITQRLAEANINPGPLAESDQAITGSNYFSYRNDQPGNPNPDPFSAITISVENQPQRVPILAPPTLAS